MRDTVISLLQIHKTHVDSFGNLLRPLQNPGLVFHGQDENHMT